MICIDFLPKHYSTDFPVYTFYVVSKKYFWQSWVHVFNSCHMLSNELHSSAVACIIYASIMYINLTQSIKYSHALYIIVYQPPMHMLIATHSERPNCHWPGYDSGTRQNQRIYLYLIGAWNTRSMFESEIKQQCYSPVN
jgi:hypothetical protein